MQRDIRNTELYREAERVWGDTRQPGTGQLGDAVEINASDGKRAVFAGTIVDKLDGTPPTRICEIDLASGETRVLTYGPNTDRLPKYSPDGRLIAFLSDRGRAGDFQLYLLDRSQGAARPTLRVDGWVEYFHWAPDGKQILLGVAGHGADISGGQGAITSHQVSQDLPSWMPALETGDEAFRWRRAWVHELATGRTQRVSPPDINVWEAVWCGNKRLAAVVSPGPGEGLWYSAGLHVIDTETWSSRPIYAPKHQMGWPAASPSGERLAVVEAICSDRWIVAGDLKLIETASGRVRRVDTAGVDVTYTEWRSDRHLLVAGHRGFDTVVGVLDAAEDAFREVWRGHDITTGGRYAAVSGVGNSGDCVLIGESFTRVPEIGVIRRGEYQPVKSLDLGYQEHANSIGAVERVSWNAPDGLEIQGWLLLPGKGSKPYPLVMNIHGGPVWQWRPGWLARSRTLPFLMLVKRGYAVFYPNPRGSSGRGQEFAGCVFGDVGGAEATDHLAGLDYLVARGVADANRLGVTGGSHGGFMTSWLIGRDSRFAAAVPVAPVTNWVSEHLISNIPHFCSMALDDRYLNSGGKYFERSPVMYAHKVKAPTLNICGALDRCTPPEEAMQFHNALLENGVESALVTYPDEGHGIHKLPACIDYAARLASWFEKHMPVMSSASS
jgi:dipeptidyl aminopeptidase/acylaminoacyl peptidase